MRCLLSKLGFVIASFFTERRYGQCKRIKYYLFSKIVMHWFKSTGKHIRICPPLFVNGGKYVTIGDNFSMLERARIEAIDCYTTQTFKPEIIIGNNVAISSACLWAHQKIVIGNNVRIGGDCIVIDSDCHSLNYVHRRGAVSDMLNTKSKQITIEDDVMIGARCIILKGVVIGARSVIGAGAVVTRSIPADCIACGNPAKIIKRI